MVSVVMNLMGEMAGKTLFLGVYGVVVVVGVSVSRPGKEDALTSAGGRHHIHWVPEQNKMAEGEQIHSVCLS